MSNNIQAIVNLYPQVTTIIEDTAYDSAGNQVSYDIAAVNAEEIKLDAKQKRDFFLIETDVWALSDRTMTAEQTAYRQALRDITDQAGFPTDITWPTKPS